MDYRGLVILVIPLSGLFAILRGGRWTWRVAGASKLLNALFWLGWTTTLVVGLFTLFGLS